MDLSSFNLCPLISVAALAVKPHGRDSVLSLFLLGLPSPPISQRGIDWDM